MKTKILLLISIAVLFFNCKKEVQLDVIKTDTIVKAIDTTVVEMHNSNNSLDWQGTYKGTTPCADCEGIATEMTLNNDLTFVLKTKYLGKGDGKVFEEKGTFAWDKSGSTITLNNLKGKPNQYKVGENRLIQLDMKGKIITGALAEKYVLTK